jgi:rubrerythrin
MYADAAAGVSSPAAKATFADLAAQEQQHFRLLQNTLDYLSDPEGFHGFDESPMLDGG